MARWAGLILVVIAATGSALAADERAVDTRMFDEHIRPLLATHCLACHGGESPKGKFRLDELSSALTDDLVREHWSDVVEKLETGEMPPKGKPQPAEQDVQAFTEWLAPRLAEADTEARQTQGRVVLRRLHRVEY